jgi:spermidine synthase
VSADAARRSALAGFWRVSKEVYARVKSGPKQEFSYIGLILPVRSLFCQNPCYSEFNPNQNSQMNQPKTNRSRKVLILILFFASGALALTYQVVWSRMMIHIFGSTAIAVGTVLAAFMTGLAIGSLKIGPYADRSSNRLRLYAWLEIAIAVTALLSHLLLNLINPTQEVLFSLIGFSASNFGLIRFLMAFLLVLMPTVLMGATLPVLTSYLVDSRESVGVKLSTLYSVNTFGAVTGVLLTGFILIRAYGIHVPVYMAVFGNLIVGIIAWLISGRVRQPKHESAPASETVEVDSNISVPNSNPVMLRIILLGLALSGFTSFAYEIYWTRSLVFILGNSTYALTTMLSAFLTGIALGGYLIQFLIKRTRDGFALFGWIQVLLGIFSALALPLLFAISEPQSMSRYMLESSAAVSTYILTGFGIAFLVMLIPAILIGATFPLAGHLGVVDIDRTGTKIGKIYAINTAGNVLGALLPGIFLLNWLGIQKGIVSMAVLNALLGFTILFIRLIPSPRHLAWRLVLPVLVVLTALTVSRAPIQFQFPTEGESDTHHTLFYREGPSATTKVTYDTRSKNKNMSVDGIVIGGTGTVDFKQLLLAHLPKLLLKDVSRELSIGIGSGIMMGESLLHPGVEKITAVEIEPGVVEGAALFRSENHDALNNPRLEIKIDDIGNFLRTTAETFDVITADEKTADEYASNGFSYSLEYYELLKLHLEEDGLVAQWIPSTLPPEQYLMILNTFVSTFPHVQLWYFLPAYQRGPFNTILIGSIIEIPVSYDHMNEQFETNKIVFKSLKKYGLTSAEAVIPQYVADEEAIRRAVANAAINSLDHPRYEFYYPWDYAIENQSKFIKNHRFIAGLKSEAYADYLARLEEDKPVNPLLKKSLEAEFVYLSTFENYQKGMSLMSLYSMFDYVLSLAPFNDSLRSRIYSIYDHTALSQRDPRTRARLKRKADMLYVTGEDPFREDD